MPRRRPPWPWYIENPGPHPFAFFISHVSEDSAEAGELKSHIANVSSRGGRHALDCFLDVYGWAIGNDIGGVIRENLLKADHLVAWITPNYLENARGWVMMEIAYAELLELSQNASHREIKFPFIVPVFRGVSIDQVARTPLLGYWQRSLISPPGRICPVPEIAQRLVDYYDQEEFQRGGSPPATPGV